MSGPAGAWRRWAWGAAAAAWAVGALVTWNVVFDGHIRAGARAYVDRQQAHVEGRGPRADMDAMMDAARAAGVRAATGWTLAELAPGCAVAAWQAARRRRRTAP